uniref:AB hydrolase-1 domain-containing protein n=1 Tax=Sinocyclocheilus rhinocerous TaxID=307959 RepID=A0A673MRV8_9TELE
MLAWHFALDRPDMVQLLIVMHAPHPTQLEGYLYRLSQPRGLIAPLNYFRSLLSVPCMLIWGEADNILVEDMSGGTRPYVRGPVVIHTIPECSHWVQQDQPEKVNKLIWDFEAAY